MQTSKVFIPAKIKNKLDNMNLLDRFLFNETVEDPEIYNMIVEILMDDIKTNGIDCQNLIFNGETPIYDKFDVYLPTSLLQKAYATDKLDEKEVIIRIKTLYEQFR